MSSLAEVFVAVSPDTKQFPADLRRDLGKVDVSAAGKKAGDGYASGFGRGAAKLVGLAAGALVSAKVVNGMKSSIKAASDLGETQSKVGVIFGKSAGVIEKFAAGAGTALGQTQQAALDANATFGIFGKGAGLTGAKLTGFTTKMTTLASDMASFSNTTPEQAIEALGAAMRGEAEPIRAYGVLLDDATLKAEAMAIGILKPTKNFADIKAAQGRAMLAQIAYNKAVKDHGKGSTEALRAQTTLGAATVTLAKKTQGTVGPLTAQQKVLAAQSAIMKQTTAAQGDFARTSGGLANQQRIAAAQVDKLKVSIGTALLPVVVQATTAFNTNLLPPLIALAQKHGPALARKLTELSAAAVPFVKNFLEKAGPWFEKIGASFRNLTSGSGDAGPALKSLADSGAKLGPLFGTLADKVPRLSAVLKISATVFGFLADHTEALRKSIPFLIAGLIAYQVAQLAGNVAALLSIPVKIGELLVNRQLVKSNKELIAARGVLTVTQAAGTVATAGNTAAEAANTGAKNAGILATVRQRIATLASAIAQRAVTAATKAWAAAQWLVNVAMTANPLGLIVLAIVAVIGVIVLIATKTTWFQTIWSVAWGAIQKAAAAVWNWLKANWPLLIAILTGPIGLVVLAIVRHWDTIKTTAEGLWTGIKSAFRSGISAAWLLMSGFFQNIIDGAAKIFGWVPGVGGKLKDASAAFGKFRDDVNARLLGITDQEIKVGITYSSKGVNLTAGTPNSTNRNTGNNRAAGGPIRGPGGPTADQAGLFALSNREWVIKAKSSQKYGDYAMASVNDGTATIIPGLAAGGRAGLIVRPSSPAISALVRDVTAHTLSLAKPFIEQGAKQFTDTSSTPGGGGNVERWRQVAMSALIAAGGHASWINSLMRRMARESGGNPSAINLWDSNAKAGHPSQGLMQTIPSTFNAYAGRYRSRGILDPFANIYAAVRYTIDRYGSGPAGWDRRGGYSLGGKVGARKLLLDRGGYLPMGMSVVQNDTGRPEPLMRTDQTLELGPATIRALGKEYTRSLTEGRFHLVSGGIGGGDAYVLQISNG